MDLTFLLVDGNVRGAGNLPWTATINSCRMRVELGARSGPIAEHLAGTQLLFDLFLFCHFDLIALSLHLDVMLLQ